MADRMAVKLEEQGANGLTREEALVDLRTTLDWLGDDVQYIDGVAAIVEDHIILKSDLIQMVNMAAIQNKIDIYMTKCLFKLIFKFQFSFIHIIN